MALSSDDRFMFPPHSTVGKEGRKPFLSPTEYHKCVPFASMDWKLILSIVEVVLSAATVVLLLKLLREQKKNDKDDE